MHPILAGIAVLLGAFLWRADAQAALLTNGGFASEASGWTITADGVVFDTAFSRGGPGDGDIAFTEAAPPGTLSQSVASSPGQDYTLTFWLAHETASFAADSFTVSFGSFNRTIAGSDTGIGYTLFAFTVPGADIAAGTTPLSFTADVPGSADFNLDDVSLALAIPEPATAMLLLPVVLVPLARRRRSL